MSLNPFVRDSLIPFLKDKRILIGITGSIAAFKINDLVRYLRECKADVKVVLTENAEHFVNKLTLESLSQNKVLTNLWDSSSHSPHSSVQGIHHIETARWTDLIIVAPASANTIAKVANGIADSLLLTEILAFRGPLLIAPAMNPAMWTNTFTQENISKIQKFGGNIVGPDFGITACNEEGLGRMSEPLELLQHIASQFTYQKTTTNNKMLINLGPTRSYLDPVRYLTNRSSGKMGAALCFEALRLGYEVTAVCGPIDFSILPSPLCFPIEIISVETATQMQNACIAHWKKSDIFIGCAAVLDWDFKNTFTQKQKKTDNVVLSTEFKQNPDILKSLAEQKSSCQFIIGFAAESSDVIENGVKKLRDKKIDAIFANDISNEGSGFESSTNSGHFISSSEVITFEKSSKQTLASKILDQISKLNHETYNPKLYN